MVNTDTFTNSYNHYDTYTGTYSLYDSLSYDWDISDRFYSQKLIFWGWLRSYHPETLIILRSFKTVIIWVKRYIRRMMFCKSGYLGKRIRKIRKGA